MNVWEQVLIPLFWLPGYYVVLHNQKKSLGYAWGLLGYPFSIHSTATHGQWGMLLLEIVALGIWVSGWHKYVRSTKA